MKEAAARVKINRLLDAAGWRFFPDENGPANIVLELHTKLDREQVDGLGDDFEKTKNGFVDFLLLDSKSFPLIVLGRRGGPLFVSAARRNKLPP